MEEKQLTPYDQLPAEVALNPYVREIYVRLKLVEDGRGPVGSTPRKEKMKIDWKVAVIVICLSGSVYIYYNMFFATSSSASLAVGQEGEIQALSQQITILQQVANSQSGPEKERSLNEIKRLQTKLIMTSGGIGPAAMPVPGMSQPPTSTVPGAKPAKPVAH